MQTLRINKSPVASQETKGRQLHLSLPRLRVPLQPGQALRVLGATCSLGNGLSRRKWVGDAWHPGDPPPPTPPHGHGGPAALPAAAPPSPPVAFAREVLGVKLWDKQEEVLTALATHRRVAVKAGNGLGKGFCAAVAVLWYLHAHQDSAIVLTTAPTFRQVRYILWRQIRNLYRPASGALGGTMLDTRWELSDGRYALGLSADGADQFQGFHSPNMFIVVDEAEGVGEHIYEAIESVMTSAYPLLLLIGNPTSMDGAFRRAFHEERAIYHTITISALESPNVVAGRIVFSGVTSSAWVDERKLVWKEDSNVYRARVLGEFPHQGENSLMSLSDIESAAKRVIFDAESWSIDGETVLGPNRRTSEEVVIAVDVARYGSDSSVILRRRGDCVEDIQVLHQQDTMRLATKVADAIRQYNPAHVHVDEIGVGSGVVDRLRQLGHTVRGVNVAERARDPKGHANLRAEGYHGLAERFKAGRITIPNDRDLISQLACLRYEFDRLDRLKIESKDDIRKRRLPSPDKADALMLAFLPPAAKLQLWV